MSYFARRLRKIIQNVIHLQFEEMLDLKIVMIMSYDKVSYLRKVHSIFILYTITFMSHHMTILGTNTTNL